MKTQPENQTNIGSNGEDFQVVDAKGRKIGAMVTTFEIDYVEIQEDSQSFWRQAPGHYFVMCPQATRDGKPYGACQRDQLFTTEAERNAARAKYFAGARKRAAKLGQQK